ncbi:MAG: phosphotyrosine protein phosphatase [Nanoarchaeota archaeon]|nr:phosphotyrosine protein phosphatase [Nanoarchaeota archaeon]
MPKTKLLFVCILNLQRSPTAESLFKNHEKFEAKSCGIDILAEKQISKQIIEWANIIFCMEDIHKNFILENFPEMRNKKIIVFNIPDVYYRNDPKLVEVLRDKLKKYL